MAYSLPHTCVFLRMLRSGGSGAQANKEGVLVGMDRGYSPAAAASSAVPEETTGPLGDDAVGEEGCESAQA